MNQREQQRLMVLNQSEQGHLTGKDAAVLMRLGLRQVRRILAAYRREVALPRDISFTLCHRRKRVRLFARGVQRGLPPRGLL